MTKARLRVCFHNYGEAATPPSRAKQLEGERHLLNHVTDWASESDAKALGEKLVRDGVWVTVWKMHEYSGRHAYVHTDHGCRACSLTEGNPLHQSETFLVPPARIREVTLETRAAITDDAKVRIRSGMMTFGEFASLNLAPTSDQPDGHA